MSEFDTYIHLVQYIEPEENAFQMFVQTNKGPWVFKGLVSEEAKNVIQSENTVSEMNANYKSQVLLSTFTKKPIEESQKIYLFIPCPNADISLFKPTYKKEKEK